MKNVDDILFVIPVRLGSTRCPRKLTKSFVGTTIFDIAVKKLLESKIIPPGNICAAIPGMEQQLVDIARKYKRIQLFFRSATSAASEGQNLVEIFEWYRLPYKYVILLNPCCPFLLVETVDKFVYSYMENKHDGMFAVVAKRNYFWNEAGESLIKWPEGHQLNTKLAPITYEAAHCLYASRMDWIPQGIWCGSFQRKNDPVLYVIENEEEVFDVDYEWQFSAAEAIWRSKNGKDV